MKTNHRYVDCIVIIVFYCMTSHILRLIGIRHATFITVTYSNLMLRTVSKHEFASDMKIYMMFLCE